LFTFPKNYCFDFLNENGGCWKKGHKAADLGILAWRFSNENEGDRRPEQNKTNFLKYITCDTKKEKIDIKPHYVS
jgi:hypothetical protein